MPELPDVEVFRQYLESTALHKKIDGIEVRSRDMLQGVPASRIKKSLKGKRFMSAHRHGKYLFTELENGDWLVLHFGMTGFLKYFKDRTKEPSHCRLLVCFSNGYFLAYDCQRKLGEIGLTGDPAAFIAGKQLGPDALDPAFDADRFKEKLYNTNASIKSALMNQKLMAGIGNIYSDEMLFQAGIHPGCKTGQVSDGAMERLFFVMKQTLKKAIEARADPEQFPSSFIIPHRRGDRICPGCKGAIEKKTIAGRTAYFCPECQKC